jgi:hypothetical protein
VKLVLSLENGYARVENLSFEVFNESTTLQESCERYKARNGYCQSAYSLTRSTAHVIRGTALSDPKLGRPPKDRRLYEAKQCLECQEEGEHNAIEAKRRYGL